MNLVTTALFPGLGDGAPGKSALGTRFGKWSFNWRWLATLSGFGL